MSGWSWDETLTGVIPPLISPLDASEEPDGPATKALVARVLDGGCTGLFVLGSSGEGAWLTPVQREAVIRSAVAAAGGRAPVLAGILLPGTRAAEEAARQAAGEGADALVVGSPYYFTVDAGAQRRHVQAILAAVPLPVLLYNIPQATHHVLAPETVATLAREHRVLGIKDSAGDFAAFQQLLALRRREPAFRVLQGHEPLAAASLLQGADGLVPGLANVAPRLFVALRQAARRGDAATCARLQAEIADLGALHAHGHWLPALKAACAALGIGTGVPAAPLAAPDEVQRRAIVEILGRHGLVGPR